MRLVFLSTPPYFSVMVTCRYHPVPPIRQASSTGSPRGKAAPSGSLFSPSSFAQAATGMEARAPVASAAPPPAAVAASAASLTKRRSSCRIVASEEQKKPKKHAITTATTRAITRLERDNPRDNPRYSPHDN